MDIKGAIDHETRCEHYRSANDRIAIKFYCCGFNSGCALHSHLYFETD